MKRVTRGPKGIPYAVTHDGRTLRYPDPDIKAHDTVRLDLESGKILDYVKFETGNLVMISPSASFFGETELEKCMEFR